MACTQQFGNRETRDGATPVPVIQEPLTEDVLAHALDHQALGLGGPGQRSGLFDEVSQKRIGKRPGKLEGSSDHLVQDRDVGHIDGADRPPGQRVLCGHDHPGEGHEHVAPRDGQQEPRVLPSGKPDPQERLAACESQPVSLAATVEVEAVVRGNLLKTGNERVWERSHYTSRPRSCGSTWRSSQLCPVTTAMPSFW